MSTAVTERLISPEEYLAAERVAERKSEYFAGRVVPMAGAKGRHGSLAHNIDVALGVRLDERGHDIFVADMRVVAARGLQYSYPDIVVADGPAAYEGYWDVDDEFAEDILLNPILIVEILSRTTERIDRGEKFERYKQIESLQDYLLVAQTAHRVEQYTRTQVGWQLKLIEGLESSVWLEALNIDLPLANIYKRVKVGPYARGRAR